MPKKYEEFIALMNGCNDLYKNEVKKQAVNLNQINGDWRFSAKGKEEKKKDIYTKLQALADNMTKIFKEACSKFLEEYAIKLPEDNKDHSVDIQNALKIIDMLGFNLDEKNLRNILSPLKGSFRNLKTIIDILKAKNQVSDSDDIPGAKLHYSPEIMRMVDEITGMNTSVVEYLDFIFNIQGIIDNSAGYGFKSETISNAPFIYLHETIPYSFLACSDWMMKAGKMYSVLENQFSNLFKVHIPTDQEMIEDILK